MILLLYFTSVPVNIVLIMSTLCRNDMEDILLSQDGLLDTEDPYFKRSISQPRVRNVHELLLLYPTPVPVNVVLIIPTPYRMI